MNKHLVLNEQILFLEMGNDPQMMLMIVEKRNFRRIDEVVVHGV
jgi:hypothetical protein